MSDILRRLFSAWVFRNFLGQRFRWYRRWFGGRWECHYIDICHNHIWLDMHPDRKWPEWRQPCSFGTPKIEDYPIKQATKDHP